MSQHSYAELYSALEFHRRGGVALLKSPRGGNGAYQVHTYLHTLAECLRGNYPDQFSAEEYANIVELANKLY